MSRAKHVLAWLRQGDYSHPGGAELVDHIWSHLPKDPEQKVLDGGCGLGGTANRIMANNWGNPLGVDIDHNVLSHARTQYPHIPFYEIDLAKIGQHFNHNHFDMVCLLSVMYAIVDKHAILKSLATVMNDQGYLIILDYFAGGNYQGTDPFHSQKPFKPLELDWLYGYLRQHEMRLVCHHSMTKYFIDHYQNLLTKLSLHYNELRNIVDVRCLQTVHDRFHLVIDMLQDHRLKGELLIVQV